MWLNKIFKNHFKKSYLHHYLDYSVKTATCAKNGDVPFFRRKSWLHYLILGFCGKTYVFEQNFKQTISKKVTYTTIWNTASKRGHVSKTKIYRFLEKSLGYILLYSDLAGKPMCSNKIFKKLF